MNKNNKSNNTMNINRTRSEMELDTHGETIVSVSWGTIDRVRVYASRGDNSKAVLLVRGGGAWANIAHLTDTPDTFKVKDFEGEMSTPLAWVRFGELCKMVGIELGVDTRKRITRFRREVNTARLNSYNKMCDLVNAGRVAFIDNAKKTANKRFDSLVKKVGDGFQKI